LGEKTSHRKKKKEIDKKFLSGNFSLSFFSSSFLRTCLKEELRKDQDGLAEEFRGSVPGRRPTLGQRCTFLFAMLQAAALQQRRAPFPELS
jgi:hypothetical protein